jgi:hypothetical protein
MGKDVEGGVLDVMEGATDEENREYSRAVRDSVAAGQAPTLRVNAVVASDVGHDLRLCLRAECFLSC